MAAMQQLYIDGDLVAPAETMQGYRPRTGEVIRQVGKASSGQVKAAVAAAKKALPDWAALPVSDRVQYIRKCADWLRQEYGEEGQASPLKQLIGDEVGKPLAEADIEIIESASFLDYFCDVAEDTLRPATLTLNKELWPSKESRVLYQPLGVVGIIKPWNYPLEMPIWSLGPALIAGNTVVLKPSEKSTEVGGAIARMVSAAGFPRGVVNVIYGDRKTGRELVRDPDVHMISFTGSVQAGREIGEICGRMLKKVSLELGGNDAAIVAADASVELTANGLVWGAFCNAGQVCVGVKRAFVVGDIGPTLIQKIVDTTKSLELGKDVGPLVDLEQLGRVERFIEDARSKGARALTGGKRATALAGSYYEPTVLVNLTPEMMIMQEECFGPVLPIIHVGSIDEAVDQANASIYGLGASVWTSSRGLAERIAERLDVGMVWVNDVNVAFAEAPWGGAKQSGLGYELSPDAILEFTRKKHLNVETSGDVRRFWWYPY